VSNVQSCTCRKSAATIVAQDRHGVGGAICHEQVQVSVSVDIAHCQSRRGRADSHRSGGRREKAASVVPQQGHILGAFVGNGDVPVTVTVEITCDHGGRLLARRIMLCRVEGILRIVDQGRDIVAASIRHNEVGESVSVEICDGQCDRAGADGGDT